MFPFHAGTACAAMLFISFVAAPCIGIWNFQVHSQLDNIVLTEMHKRSFEPQLRMTKPFHSKPLHSVESRNEGRPTIRIDKVITCVDSNGYNVSLLSNGHCISNRQHHRIAVWHNCYRHVRCHIVSVRNGNSVSKGRSFKEPGDAGQINHIERSVKSLCTTFCKYKLLLMPLPIVK